MTQEEIEEMYNSLPKPWPDKSLDDLNKEVIKRINKKKYGKSWKAITRG